MTLSIIILSHNTLTLLRACLKSLNREIFTHLKSINLEVIVVDNASTDGSGGMVAKEFPGFNLIKLTQNLGFAVGNNVGLTHATGDYVMLLNSDVEFTAPDTLEKLLNYLVSHPQVAVITPEVLLPDGSLDPACHRGMPTPWNALTYFSGMEKLFPHTKLFAGYHQSFLDMTKVHPVPAVAATAILVRKPAIDEVGPLDERFFLYAEDLDWCKRFTETGWQIIYYPHTSVLHHKSASGKKKSSDTETRSQSVAYFYDTMKLFYKKHYLHKYPRWLNQLVFWGIDLKKKLHSL